MTQAKMHGHISKYDGLYTTIMQGMVEGVCKRGRPKAMAR